ncbi:MAG: hypothetical protein KME54_26780 [Tolypothrix brevis GSE-NOS-MK-07-07A]|jgi:hypothetical protein|nr:hypothetical protein [Tolypothrix brevis GSE-NOS-MK-07-07A]
MKLIEKIKRSRLLLRIWFWAAVHSPRFHRCQLRLRLPLVEVELSKNTCRYGSLRFIVTINDPALTLDIPWIVCESFAFARKQAGEIIDLAAIDNIPF